ncbi:MAG TPA: hypothetical protein VF625_18345 [Longimicrobium sp.]|jgi:hypothetical protein
MIVVPLPTLPFADPVLIVAVATLIFLVVPRVAERARVPDSPLDWLHVDDD